MWTYDLFTFGATIIERDPFNFLNQLVRNALSFFGVDVVFNIFVVVSEVGLKIFILFIVGVVHWKLFLRVYLVKLD